MNDFLSLAKQRRTTVEFDTKPVGMNLIKSILEAGRWAPSIFNLQPWHFIVVQDKESVELLTKLCAYNRVFGQPAAMIAIVSDLTFAELKSFYGEAKLPADEHMKCMGMAALNIVYAAESLGLKTAIMSPRKGVAEKMLGVPEGQKCEVIVGIGYESETEPKNEIGRLPLNDIVSYGKYKRKRAKLTGHPVKQNVD